MNRIVSNVCAQRFGFASLTGLVLACVLSTPAWALENPLTANAGPDQTVVVGQPVYLSGSYEPIVLALSTYDWTFVATPAGSAAALTGANTRDASFTPDVPGVYLTGLTVAVSGFGGAYDEVTITAVAPGDYVQAQVAEVLDIIAALSASDFSAAGHQNAVSNFLQQVVTAIEADDPGTALAKLDAAIERTDGFPLRGALDTEGNGKDWVVDEAAQYEIYPLLVDARNAIAP